LAAAAKRRPTNASQNNGSDLAFSKESSAWTFLTNHAHVLLCLAREPEVRMREIANLVGITERAVQRIVTDLEEAGHLARVRQGRRNHYKVRADLPLRHPIEEHVRVSALIDFVTRERSRLR
jgi:predicted transcriptional regulator